MKPPIVPRTTWGYRGVEQVRPGRFRATIGNHAWRSRYFSTTREAAEAYDREARRRYGKHGYFNFPKANERRVQPMDETVCHEGHARAAHVLSAGRPCRVLPPMQSPGANALRGSQEGADVTDAPAGYASSPSNFPPSGGS
jgi:hypothetical protein